MSALPAPDPAAIIAGWCENLQAMTLDRAPCDWIRPREWPELRTAWVNTASLWGGVMLEHGLDTLDLWGCHRKAGLIRPDSSGCIVASCRPPRIRYVGSDPLTVRYASGGVWRGMSNRAESIPVWEFIRQVQTQRHAQRPTAGAR